MTKINALVSPEHIAALEAKLAPVHMHYQRRDEPQNAFIFIDAIAEKYPVYASYWADIGTEPIVDWTGQRQRISIPADSIGKSIIAFIDTNADLFQRVIVGHELYYDDKDRRGRLSDDAAAAFLQLETLALDEIEVATVYSRPADLWLDDEITADTDPQELADDYLAGRDDNAEMWDFEPEELVEYITERKAALFPEDDNC